MKLPGLPVLLIAIGAVWCVAGVIAHGWVMLAYPLIWAAIGAAFLILNGVYNAMYPAVSADQPEQGSRRSLGNTTNGLSQRSEKSSRQTVA